MLYKGYKGVNVAARPPEARVLSALNLPLISIPHPAWMPDSPAKAREESNWEQCMLDLMATPAQQSSHAKVPPMPVVKWTSPPITSYLSLSDTFPNTMFWSLVETWMLKWAKTEIITSAHTIFHTERKNLLQTSHSRTCLNTKLWPYIYRNNSKEHLDYIFINKNCEAYSSFEGVSSNHRIVSAKICKCLLRNKSLSFTIWLVLSYKLWYKQSLHCTCKKSVSYSPGDIWKTYSRWQIWKLCYCPYGSSSGMHTNQIKNQM